MAFDVYLRKCAGCGKRRKCRTGFAKFTHCYECQRALGIGIYSEAFEKAQIEQIERRSHGRKTS